MQERDANYAAPLRVKVRLHNKKDDTIKDQLIYVGEFPLMTDTGTFIINGAERVIISQLVRSPGAYFDIVNDKNDVELYTAQIIPNRGAWLEFETDGNGLLWVRVDRTRKFHLSILLRSLGFGSDKAITDVFGEEESLVQTMLKDGCSSEEDGLQEMFKKLRSGEVYTIEGARNFLQNMFFEAHRYDLAKVGIYKLNKKLALKRRLVGHTAATAIVDEDGEILAMPNDIITADMAEAIQNAGINAVDVYPMHFEAMWLSKMRIFCA